MALIRHARVEQAITFMRRWYLLWHALYYVLLITLTVITFWFEPLSREAIVLLLVLTLLFAGWYAPFTIISPMFWRNRPLLTIGYLAISWPLWFFLANSYSPYGAMLFVLYPQICTYLPRLWKFPALLVLTLLVLWKPIFPQGIDSSTLFTLLGIVFSTTITALYIEQIIEQNYEKDRLLRALEETRLELATAERRAGAAEERQQLGYAIHDTLAQGFTSILMHVAAAESALPDRAQHHLDQIAQTARENLAEARRLLWALQPEEPDRLPLPEALTHLCEKWSEESGIPASIAVVGRALALRPEIEVTLLRAAQEALANIRKHARAGRVTLTLSYMDDLVVVDVQDDGVGFDPQCNMQQAQVPLNLDEQIRGGFGLKALRERVGQLGGTVAIESAPGEGTTLAVELPALGICEKAQANAQQGATQ